MFGAAPLVTSFPPTSRPLAVSPVPELPPLARLQQELPEQQPVASSDWPVALECFHLRELSQRRPVEQCLMPVHRPT